MTRHTYKFPKFDSRIHSQCCAESFAMPGALRILLISLLVAASHAALDATCDDGVFCNGISVKDAAGKCTPLSKACDDEDPTTVDACEEYSQRCTHMPLWSNGEALQQTCRVDCEPDCTNPDDGSLKMCGENGCNGFCGQCPEGEGCSSGICVAGAQEGSCTAPFSLLSADPVARRATTGVLSLKGDARRVVQLEGDTTHSVHLLTPSCNYLTAAQEIIYSFSLSADSDPVGYDIRVSGYDTVLEIMEGQCSITASVGCSDDATPPSNYGSRVSGVLTPGKEYYVMVDGFSSGDFGRFTLTASFVANCQPHCDGNFCGNDSCGGSCGHASDATEAKPCGTEFVCGKDLKCYQDPCTPNCENRECGEDGCGGSCGQCDGGKLCTGAMIADAEDDEVPPSECAAFSECDNFAPTCENCQDGEVCGSDCECHQLDDIPDMTVLVANLRDEMFIQDVFFPDSSCAMKEGCITQPGWRRLLRFTSTVLNQGTGDFSPPAPKSRPDLFMYGPCHQHYHYRNFATYTLFDSSHEKEVLKGQKYAYCMEDTARYFSSSTEVSCNKAYDCGAQGVQKGWVDSYQWGLDCSWVDITDLAAGNYVLELAVNPGRSFHEISFDNNRAAVTVEIPTTLGELSAETTPLKADTKEYDLGPALPANEALPSSGLSRSKPGTSWKAILTIVFFLYCTCLTACDCK